MTPTPLAPTVALPIAGVNVPVYALFEASEQQAMERHLAASGRSAILALKRDGLGYDWRPVVRGVVQPRCATYPAAAAVLAESLS